MTPRGSQSFRWSVLSDTLLSTILQAATAELLAELAATVPRLVVLEATVARPAVTAVSRSFREAHRCTCLMLI
jgi:hypothetical protein